MTRNSRIILFILGMFVAAAVVLNSSSGTDSTAAYIGCRLVLAGQSSHLYAFDPKSFNVVSDRLWLQIAAARGIAPNVALSTFVQTPLWPTMLQPLCGSMSFPAFNRLFEIAVAVCFAAMIWLTGRHWAPRFFTPPWVLAMCLLWLRADPLRSAILLTNTHAIFLLLTLLAILWARSGRPVPAGASLAFAAAIKITPAVFVIYWLVTKQRKAALSFVLWSAALILITLATSGPALTLNYLHSMSRVSHTLVLSELNQSFAAWWMGHRYPASWSTDFHYLPMPAAMSMVSSILVVLSAILGGYCDRSTSSSVFKRPPYGAVLTLIGATIFTPIAWGHYYILLVIPIILLLNDCLRKFSLADAAIVTSIFLLANTRVLMRQIRPGHVPELYLVRGQFYAGVFAMIGMIFLYWRSLHLAETTALPSDQITSPRL